jgi:dolichol-phosphate mannosyltransferase
MKTLIICPVYNEERYLASFIDEVRYVCDCPILIINGGSTDHTLKIIKSKCPDFLINHTKNIGYGKSLIDGFNFAVGNNYHNIITIDGDLQHDARMIPIFFEKIKKYDIVSGSRYLYICEHPDIEPPQSYFVYHQLITNIINETFKSSITDAFCGYKAYLLEKIKLLDLDIDGYGIAIQIIIQILYKQLKYTELPVLMIYHNPVIDRVHPTEKTKYFLDTLKAILQKVKCYDERIFNKHIVKWRF